LLEGVREVMRKSTTLQARSASSSRKAPSSISAAGVKIGGPEVVVAAGPCSVEPRTNLFHRRKRRQAGAKILRGGAFNRVLHLRFQGMGEPGLKLMREAADKFGLFTISEVMDARQIR